MEKRLFTSESVTEGHPDKMCDAISDAILDALLEQDPMSRVACETATTTGLVLVMGEITTSAYVDIQKIVRETVREIGYDRAKYGFDCDTCGVITAIDEQSKDIALGVDKALEAKEAAVKDSLNIFVGRQSPCGAILIKQDWKMLLTFRCCIYILLCILSQSLACIIYCASCALITTANGKNRLWCGERFARFNSLHPLAKLTVCKTT